MKIQFFSVGTLYSFMLLFPTFFVLTKLLWLMNESSCSTLLTRWIIHGAIFCPSLFYFLSLILCFTMRFLWHIDNLLSERKELWCDIFPLFSTFSSDCCTSRFFRVQAVDCINVLLKEQVYLCTVDFSQRSIMWSIKNTMTTVVRYPTS